MFPFPLLAGENWLPNAITLPSPFSTITNLHPRDYFVHPDFTLCQQTLVKMFDFSRQRSTFSSFIHRNNFSFLYMNRKYKAKHMLCHVTKVVRYIWELFSYLKLYYWIRIFMEKCNKLHTHNLSKIAKYLIEFDNMMFVYF